MEKTITLTDLQSKTIESILLQKAEIETHSKHIAEKEKMLIDLILDQNDVKNPKEIKLDKGQLIVTIDD